MPGVISLEEIVRVSPRFTRSIALGRDFDRADALEGYILTPTGRIVLSRLIEALRGESPARAWSLTSPIPINLRLPWNQRNRWDTLWRINWFLPKDDAHNERATGIEQPSRRSIC